MKLKKLKKRTRTRTRGNKSMGPPVEIVISLINIAVPKARPVAYNRINVDLDKTDRHGDVQKG